MMSFDRFLACVQLIVEKVQIGTYSLLPSTSAFLFENYEYYDVTDCVCNTF